MLDHYLAGVNEARATIEAYLRGGYALPNGTAVATPEQVLAAPLAYEALVAFREGKELSAESVTAIERSDNGEAIYWLARWLNSRGELHASLVQLP